MPIKRWNQWKTAKAVKVLSNSRSVDSKIDSKWLVSRHSIIDKVMTLTTPIWDSKAKKLKPRMTIAQACSEMGITPQTYNNWLREDPLLAQMVEDVFASHRQMMDDMANAIILEWLNGDVKLRPSEKIWFAFRYLEKTSPHFNPSQKIELEASQNHFNMSEEEIINRLKELSQETWDELLIPNQTKQEDVSYTESNTIEEQTRMAEEASGWSSSEWDTNTSWD